MAYHLAPGHVLQLHHLRRRLGHRKGQTFIEVGAGSGLISNTLLAAGLHGEAFDLNANACAKNLAHNAASIAAGRYAVHHADFITAPVDRKVDIVISCMVIEHLQAEQVRAYMRKCKAVLDPGGLVISIVPASPRHWGIEDEIAGHVKRYTPSSFEELATEHGLRVIHTAGLTYPLSNWLLPISNFLVARKERSKLELSMDDRTVRSGDRDVKFKTTYPSVFRLLINEVTLAPFILLQHLYREHPSCLVLYNEMDLRGGMR